MKPQAILWIIAVELACVGVFFALLLLGNFGYEERLRAEGCLPTPAAFKTASDCDIHRQAEAALVEATVREARQ